MQVTKAPVFTFTSGALYSSLKALAENQLVAVSISPGDDGLHAVGLSELYLLGDETPIVPAENKGVIGFLLARGCTEFVLLVPGDTPPLENISVNFTNLRIVEHQPLTTVGDLTAATYRAEEPPHCELVPLSDVHATMHNLTANGFVVVSMASRTKNTVVLWYRKEEEVLASYTPYFSACDPKLLEKLKLYMGSYVTIVALRGYAHAATGNYGGVRLKRTEVVSDDYATYEVQAIPTSNNEGLGGETVAAILSRLKSYASEIRLPEEFLTHEAPHDSLELLGKELSAQFGQVPGWLREGKGSLRKTAPALVLLSEVGYHIKEADERGYLLAKFTPHGSTMAKLTFKSKSKQ